MWIDLDCENEPNKVLRNWEDVNFQVEVEQVEALEEWNVVDTTLACNPLEN